MRLRPVRDDEIEDAVGLLNRSYRGEGAEAGWTTEHGLLRGPRMDGSTLRRMIGEGPDASFLVWRSGDAIVGTVWVEPAEDGLWHLGSLSIEPARQNAGRGRLLLRSAEAWVSARGGTRVEITVLDVRSSLLGWYERRGYVRTGRSEPWPDGDLRFGLPLVSGLRFAHLGKLLPPTSAPDRLVR